MKAYTLFLALLMSAVSFSSYSADLEFEPSPIAAIGIRGGTNNDINDKPAVYVSAKMTHLYVGNTRKVHFFVPGIGVQTGNSSTKINLSLAPLVFEGNQGWNFGIDIFANTDSAKSGRSNYGFFIGKAF